MGLNLFYGELRGYSEKNYCPKCKEGDIIDMYLDLNNFELKYSINDKDYGKAFDVENTSYRAVVCCGGSDDNLH